MIVRALDGTHDWTFGKGKNDYLTFNKAIGQNIDTRLFSFLGDCYFDIQAGIDWFNLIGSKNVVGLNLAVSAVILNTENVTGLLQLLLDLNRQTRKLTIQYEVTTAYTGLLTSDGTILKTVDFLLSEDGFIITTESGDKLIV